MFSALLNDFGEQFDHALARGVAFAVSLRGCIGPKDGQGRQTVIQIMVQFLYFLENVRADVFAVEAPTGGQNGEFRQGRQQVDFAGFALPEFVEIATRFFFNFSDIGLQTRGTQTVRHGLKLHLPILFGGVVDNAGSKDGLHKVVDFILGKNIIRGFEEYFLRLGSDQIRETLVEDLSMEVP